MLLSIIVDESHNIVDGEKRKGMCRLPLHVAMSNEELDHFAGNVVTGSSALFPQCRAKTETSWSTLASPDG